MPTRMCMVCRRRAEKKELIRAVISGDKAVVDKTGKAQSRGFYLCPECISEIRKKRVLERVLKRKAEPGMYDKFIADAEGLCSIKGDKSNER